MPMAYVFPRGDGGGAPVPTGWTNIGDISGLTFSDPASLLTSYAFNAGDHEFTMTTQLANGDYALNSGSKLHWTKMVRTSCRWNWSACSCR
jgi:hypothetical protein